MDRYLTSISGDAAAFAAVVETGPLDAPVPSCPGWDVRALAEHLGWVHRWARLAAATAQQPDAALIDPAPQSGAVALADWLREGAAALVATLATIPPDSPTWHPFPVPRFAAVWPRRQAHELAIHRWDIEAAVGQPSPLDPALAGDFVAEYLEVVVPRVVSRDGRLAPQGDLLIELTDVGVAMGVHVDGEHVERVGSSALTSPSLISGTAEDVLLALWCRRPLPVAPTDDRAVAWLAFGGN